MNADRVPVYNFHDTSGMLCGCGTQTELDHWSAQGVMDGYTVGKVIAYESPETDRRRKAAWALEAA